MSKNNTKYRVLAPCRIGCFRDEGEVFSYPKIEPCPDYLEEIDIAPGGTPAEKNKKSKPDAPGGTPAEVFIENP